MAIDHHVLCPGNVKHRLLGFGHEHGWRIAVERAVVDGGANGGADGRRIIVLVVSQALGNFFTWVNCERVRSERGTTAVLQPSGFSGGKLRPKVRPKR